MKMQAVFYDKPTDQVSVRLETPKHTLGIEVYVDQDEKKVIIFIQKDDDTENGLTLTVDAELGHAVHIGA